MCVGVKREGEKQKKKSKTICLWSNGLRNLVYVKRLRLKRENISCRVVKERSVLVNMEEGWFGHLNSVEETIGVLAQSINVQAGKTGETGRIIPLRFAVSMLRNIVPYGKHGMWNNSGTGQREMGDFRNPTNFDVQQIHAATHRSRDNRNKCKISNKTWQCNADHPHRISFNGERVEWSRLPYPADLYAVVPSGFPFFPIRRPRRSKPILSPPTTMLGVVVIQK